MRSSVCVFLAFLLLCASFFCVHAGAADPWTEDAPAGQVLYRQSFADVSDYAKSGLVTGTSTAEAAEIGIRDGALQVRSVDGGRAYTLLPTVTRGTSYTVEFSFRFTESGRVGGTLSFLLTCRGEEPTNITSLVIRGNGTVDDFSEPDDDLARAIKGGYWVDVAIPVEDGALHRMTMTVQSTGTSYELERASVLVLTPGSMGFSFRNTCAAISDIWLVNGVDYSEKTGDTTSYIVDREASGDKEQKTPAKTPEPAPPKPADPAPPVPERSPNTRDHLPGYGMVAALSVTSACALGCGFSVRRHRV
ncbi:MAG: hypothetical protein II889_10370 [Clostridia bacterium]|nr:hypothetical protein [Clostridia bacterium]